jgi:hypothetical protein
MKTIQSLSGISFAEFPDGASSNFGGGYIYPNSIELADRALIEPYLAEGQNMNPADGRDSDYHKLGLRYGEAC